MRAQLFVFLFTAICLTSCGGSSGNSSNPVPPVSSQNSASASTDNLNFSVNFPLNDSLTVQEKISFSGQIDGYGELAGIEIALDTGIDQYTAQIDQGQWSISDVELIRSSLHHYNVTLTLDGQTVAVEEVALTQDDSFLPFGVVNTMAVNTAGSRAYLVQDHALLGIDLLTGERLTVARLPDSLSGRVLDMEVIPNSDLIVLLDQFGDIHYLSAQSTNDLMSSIVASIDSIAVSPDGYLYAHNSAGGSILRFDEQLNLDDEIFLPPEVSGLESVVENMAFISERILVLHGGSELVFFDIFSLTSENLSLVSQGIGIVNDLAVDPTTQQIYVTNTSTNNLLRLDTELGTAQISAMTEIALDTTPPHAIVFSASRGGVVFAARNELHLVDSASGSTSLLSGLKWGAGATWVTPSSLTLGDDGESIFVSDLATDDIYQVQLDTGDRSPLNTSGDQLEAVTGMVQSGTSIYSVDWVRRSVLMTEVASGVTSDIVVDTPNQTQFVEPVSIDMEGERFRVFVLDRGNRAIYEVDTASGNTQKLLDGQNSSALTLARDLSFDQESQSIFWSSWFDNGLHRLNLNTNQYDLITNSAQNQGERLGRPASLAIARNASVAYLTDALSDRLLSVDLESGTSSLLYQPDILLSPSAIDYDESRNLVHILDSEAAALYALNPDTGDLLLLSM